MKSFRDLNCWKEGRAFRNTCFELVKTFPNEEKFKLSDQLIGSSKGVTVAIAEGLERFHFQENIQYCRIARGSLQESCRSFNCCLRLRFYYK